ncbi:hypothetical protein ACR42D_15275 [Desulfovibrio caledoniensis]
MQEKMSKPEETAVSSEGTNGHARKTDEPDARASEGKRSACGIDEDDFDYMVTPFPEFIGKHLFFNRLYLPWVAFSLALAAIRVSAMAICGEESGRFALNIVYALLPGLLAILIIAYSKQTERATIVFCNMAADNQRDKVIEAYEKLVRRAFDNRGMVVMGVIFVALFWPGIEDRQIYPTPSHNILHREILRDRTLVTVGKTWERTPQADNSGPTTPAESGRVSTWGWVELPLGKVLRLARDENLAEQDSRKQRPGNYAEITLPPQDIYDPLPPDPTFDENIDDATYKKKQRIDPEWSNHSPRLKRMSEYKDKGRPPIVRDTSPEGLRREREKTEREEKDEWEKRRADQLPGPLRFVYQRKSPAQRWLLSQKTYKMVMLPLLFMSGAMLWCLGGITWLTWSLGRKQKRGEKNIWQTIEIGIHPRLSRSVRDVGKNLWLVAVITGAIYTVIVICMFFARADALSLTISSIFSLVVVTIFIVPQLNMHRLMVRSKYRKMCDLNFQLDNALNELKDNQDAESIEKANAILELQKGLGDCCEWPYDFSSLAMVVGSVIIPVLMAIFTLYEHFK